MNLLNKSSIALNPLVCWQHFKILASTNDTALAENTNHILLISADSQTKGRGRQQKKWENTQNSLLFSLSIPFQSPKDISTLPIATAMSLVSTLSQFTDQSLWIKWPNDIYIGNHQSNAGKCCGILIETTLTGSKGKVIIGVGINLSPLQKSIQADYQTGFMDTQIDKKTLMFYIVNHLIMQWENTLNNPEIDPNLYKPIDYLDEKSIIATHIITNKTFKGIAKGINKQGHLQILKETGIMTLSQPYRIRLV